jgi:hypothetical protein
MQKMRPPTTQQTTSHCYLTVPFFCKRFSKYLFHIGVATTFVLNTNVSLAQNQESAHSSKILLINDDGSIAEQVLEAFLAPGEFVGRHFEYLSEGDEALYSLDSSLGSAEPFAELHPARLEWPWLAGLPLKVEAPPLKLKPSLSDIDDDVIDEGFSVQWTIAPLGQRFDPSPHFAATVVSAEVIGKKDGRRLFYWHVPPKAPICQQDSPLGSPRCVMKGLSLETRALALSPDGKYLALALGGLKPRLEIYSIVAEPRLSWQSFFGKDSGGVQEVAFSADGRWVVALTGRGRMHRFAALSGGEHLAIASAGRAARSIPPGRVMAVAGESGEVNLWYLADGTIAWRLPPRSLRGPVDRLAASGDGRRFATLEYDERRTVVRVWEVRRRAMLAQIEVDPYSVADIALDTKGETLFVAHEKLGLLETTVAKNAQPSEVGGEAGSRCRGRIAWISGRELLGCAVPGGEIQVDRKGRIKGELVADIEASNWIVATSAGGKRLAAVGGGHLLIWWTK